MAPSSPTEPIAELEHLGEVVAGVDVHDRERDPTRPEGFLGQPEHDHRVLAPREEQDRALELGRHLPDDVDGLRLDVLELGQLVLTRTACAPTPIHDLPI